MNLTSLFEGFRAALLNLDVRREYAINAITTLASVAIIENSDVAVETLSTVGLHLHFLGDASKFKL